MKKLVCSCPDAKLYSYIAEGRLKCKLYHLIKSNFISKNCKWFFILSKLASNKELQSYSFSSSKNDHPNSENILNQDASQPKYTQFTAIFGTAIFPAIWRLANWQSSEHEAKTPFSLADPTAPINYISCWHFRLLVKVINYKGILLI